MAKVFIFCPAFRGILYEDTAQSLEQLGHALMNKGIPAFSSRLSWPDIEELRNAILSFWYDMSDASHLLFVDSDMVFKPDVVLDMLAFNEPLVGAVYRKRSMELDWAASALPNPELRGNAFLELEGVGTGLMLIRRDAVRMLIDAFPDLIYPHVTLTNLRAAGLTRTLGFFDQMRVKEGKVAEDISFCRRFREAGGRVWGAIAHEIGHIGEHNFSGCFARDGRVKKEDNGEEDSGGSAARAHDGSSIGSTAA